MKYVFFYIKKPKNHSYEQYLHWKRTDTTTKALNSRTGKFIGHTYEEFLLCVLPLSVEADSGTQQTTALFAALLLHAFLLSHYRLFSVYHSSKNEKSMLVNSKQSLKNQKSTKLLDSKEVKLYRFLKLFHSKHSITAIYGPKIMVMSKLSIFIWHGLQLTFRKRFVMTSDKSQELRNSGLNYILARSTDRT